MSDLNEVHRVVVKDNKNPRQNLFMLKYECEKSEGVESLNEDLKAEFTEKRQKELLKAKSFTNRPSLV